MLPQSIQNLINQLCKLPGIGPRAATRLAFFMLRRFQTDNANLGQAIIELKASLKRCRNCFNIANSNLCAICSDKKRDISKICIIEDYMDLISLEKSADYNGLYHVLGGTISAQDGIQIKHLTIKPLIQRIKNNSNIQEIIIATNPTTEGDTTALYLAKLLKPYKLKITRLARGLPTGGDIEYLDERTLSAALQGRKEI